MIRHPAVAPVLFLVLALAWTWPAAVSADWVGRHSDTLGTVWALDAAGRLLGGGLRDDATAWPIGVRYLRPDSFWALPVGALLAPLMGAARLHGWLQVLGVAGSAWAAEACARRLGAERPASLLAGLAFAFGGLASTVLLEGHVYQLLDPWLPLCLAAGWLATGPDGRPVHGVLAAVGWLGALLTTAYLGVAATGMLGALVAGAWLDRRDGVRMRPLLAGLAVCLPLGLAYTAVFLAGEGDLASPERTAGGPAATLASLLGPSSTLDTFYHSQSAVLPPTILALFLVSPAVLTARSRWRPVAFAGLVSAVASFGPSLSIDPAASLFPTPYSLLGGLPGVGFLHFPGRLGWGFALCAGVVAAQVATVLLGRHPRLGLLLAGLLLVDCFGLLDMPGRQRVQGAALPSAYAATSGPVLDLFPTDVHPTRALDLQFMTLACAYQTVHRRPIAEVCFTTSPWRSPRARLGRWVWSRALRGEPLAEGLAEMGFGAVVVHAGLFRPFDAALLRAALLSVDAGPVTSLDGGEHVEAYAIPPIPAPDPARAYARWVGSGAN